MPSGAQLAAALRKNTSGTLPTLVADRGEPTMIQKLRIPRRGTAIVPSSTNSPTDETDLVQVG